MPIEKGGVGGGKRCLKERDKWILCALALTSSIICT